MPLNCGAGEDSWCPLDTKEIKPVNLKEEQPWIFTVRTEAEAETPLFWSSDVNRRLIGKVPDSGTDWRQKEKKASEDEMAGWYHWCSEDDLQQIPGDGEGKGGLVCCSPWGRKELDVTGWLNNNMINPQQTLFSMVKSWKHFLQDQEQDKCAHSCHYYSSQSLIYGNQRRKRNKRNPDWKRSKTHCLQMTWYNT